MGNERPPAHLMLTSLRGGQSHIDSGEQSRWTEQNKVSDTFAVTQKLKVIAEALGMSWRTVQKHLERIYQKLGVPTRAKAIVLLTGTGHGTKVRNSTSHR